jgi:chemotaxis protein CheD
VSHPSSSRGRGSGDRDDGDGYREASEAGGGDAAERRIKVGVGELAVATDGEMLTTSGLGSCVAVALGDERAGVGVRGLLHAMLPTSDEGRTAAARRGKYVDAGIDALVDDLVAAGAAPDRLEARVAGGAEMLNLTDAVGPRNVERAERCLASAGVPVVASDVGDGVGRTVRFGPDGGLVVRAADGFERTL